MEWSDFLGVIVPICVSMFLTWLPSLAGDFIDTQARDMIARLKRSGLPNTLADQTQQDMVNFAKGAVLASAWFAMFTTYLYGLVSAVPHTRHAGMWWTAVTIWGVLALCYTFHTLLTRKLFELCEVYVRNPFSKNRPFAKLTHYGALTAVLTISGLIVITAACDGYFLPDAEQPAAQTNAVLVQPTANSE